ncbi:MAG TPA: hypothetical protein VKA84_23815 [Gemmatimonadaceae bacterium]|nr:hypothetical protein [Gemmatimonadaceae bacterium]
MATPSPFRSLSQERRVALVTHAMKSSREVRALYVQRLVARGGGFRAATLQTWPVDKLAREIVRMNAQSAEDELDLLHLLYVELEPAIQTTFLDAAGVRHENGRIPDDLETPYADAESVRRAAAAVREAHGADGMHYLRTIARYSTEAWPGIVDVLAELEAAQA